MICSAPNYTGTQLNNYFWTNWSGSQARNIDQFHKPKTLEDLVWLVAKATDEGRELHAVGTGWAFEDAAGSSDWVVSLDNLDKEITTVVPAALNAEWRDIQNDHNQDSLIHVEAGIEIGELNDLLTGRNLAMRTLGGSNGQTLAGAVSTSTHGGDIAMRPLPDQVYALHIVTDGGHELWIERHSAPITTNALLAPLLACQGVKIIRNDDVFNAALVSVGRFGAVYAMVLRVTPAFRLAEWTNRPTTSFIIDRLRAGVTAGTGLAPLLAALPAPLQMLSVNPGTPTHFVQLFFNSQFTSECLVTRRWRTFNDDDLRMDQSGDPMCDPAVAVAILHATAAALRNEAALLMLIPITGPVWAMNALHTAHVLEIQATVVGATGGEALASSVNALWNNNLGSLVPEIARMALNGRFGPSESGKRGPSNLITSGRLGTGKDRCLLSDSIEVIFPAGREDYLNFLQILLAAAPSLHQSGYISLRYSLPSRALLSMHNSTDQMVVSIEVSSVQGLQGGPSWMNLVETLAIANGGRPHWGQMNKLTKAQVTHLYGANLVRWREALLSVSGISKVFSNNYTRQRGLEPVKTLRQVTGTRKVEQDSGKVVTHLCGGAGAAWRPVSVATAIDQIENGSVDYFTHGSGNFAHVQVVDDPRGKYLRSKADPTTANNLDDLPDCLPGVVSVVAAAQLSTGALQLWSLSPNGSMFSTWKTSAAANATWTPWSDFATEVGALPGGAQQIAAAPLSNGALQLWAISNGSVFSTWKTSGLPNATWTPWSDFFAD